MATTPDLVLLSLLAEGPRHGYGLNQELERRDVEDWAAVSRPQVYYSLKKLERNGWIVPDTGGGDRHGPERQVYRLTPEGREVLREGLRGGEWATGRTLPPFVTWLALSPHAEREDKSALVAGREAYLRAQIERERGHLRVVEAEGGEAGRVGVLMVRYAIATFELELSWLAEVRATLLDGGSSEDR